MVDIELRYVGERPPAVATETVIENAVKRWERVIRENGATGARIVASSQWTCWDTVLPFGAYIDDLLIYVYLKYLKRLDGPAARAGPCFIRAPQADGAPGLPYIGMLRGRPPGGPPGR